MSKLLELPEYGRHIVAAGSTGSGKSFLMGAMLKKYENFFAIDTQDSLHLPKSRVIKDLERLKMELFLFKKIHYTPKPELLEREYFDYLFKTVLDSSTKKKPRPRIIYIDEIYHVGYGTSFPRWLPKSITTARQRKLSFWIATQRPKQIPVPVLSEASKIYVFYLSKLDDAKYLSTFARSDPKELFNVLANQEDDYSFVIIDCRKGTWEKYPALKIK